MKKTILFFMTTILMACGGKQSSDQVQKTPDIDSFNYAVDRFADIEILRYRVPDFENLTLKQKELVYYLSQAALEGRDIIYDQNNKYNLSIRRTLEAVYENYTGDRNNDEFKNLTIYLKRIWMANGIHHHYSEDKFHPDFSQDFFTQTVKSIDPQKLPLQQGETVDELIKQLTPVIFDPTIFAKKVNSASGIDIITSSAENYYENVTQKEVEDFYGKMKNPADSTPISYGLNSKLIKENGLLAEKTYKVGGMYGAALSKIVYWLEKAEGVAENTQQKKVISTLIDYYKTGNLKTFDKYSIEWVKDLSSLVDFVNGFTETYGDPLGMKASWESIVNFKNLEATKRTEIISNNAQWFENNSPTAKEYKKEKVKGVSAKVITVAILAGDCYPSTPIGINLPNADWIRARYGSKSVTIENITEAYNQASLGNGFSEEFMWSPREVELTKEYGELTDNLHTDLHECLGHGSGKLLPGVDPDALKSYGSTIEEARADLFGLYFLGDNKLVELGLLPNDTAYQAEYYKYMMNGLMTQLTRIQPGKNIEESHMRNRALIAYWVYEHGKADNVVEFKHRNGKTYVVVNDYEKMHTLLGELLADIQRIKSTGDYNAGKELVEKYGVKVNPELHKEVLTRYERLNLAPYRGFVNPVYTVVADKDGKITDINISYKENFIDQSLRYSRDYSTLPNFN